MSGLRMRLIAMSVILVLSSASCASERNGIGHHLMRFVSREGTIERRLTLTPIDSRRMQFTIELVRERDRLDRYSGIAIQSEGDPEVYEDENGNPYPMIQYLSPNPECWVMIHLAGGTPDRAVFFANSCPGHSGIGSDVLMHKVD